MAKSEGNGKRLLLISNSTLYGSGYLDHAEAKIRTFFGAIRRVLFVPFALYDRQAYASKARAREWGGAGLGLSIARWAVEAHGGEMTLESEEGRGCTFRMSPRSQGFLIQSGIKEEPNEEESMDRNRGRRGPRAWWIAV